MAKFRVFIIAILLFLCLFSVAGKRGVNIVIKVGDDIFSKTYYEDASLFIRIFESPEKRINKMLKSYDEREVVKRLYPILYTDIEKIMRDYLVLPKDATVRVVGQEQFSFNKEKYGRKIDEKIYCDILNALKNKNTIVTADFLKLAPNVLKKDLIKNTTFRGEFSTNYSDSTSGRKNNIKVATQYLNGCVIRPKEVFSFNNVVGERCIERGFSEAVVIENGSYTVGVGGGVCQVATTLYNALLLSDIRVTNVSRHSFSPKYVPHSRDAMVSQFSDLRFQNTEDYNIYIFAYADDDNLTVKIYGGISDIFVELQSVDTGVKLRDVEYIENKNLPLNTERVVREGFDGVKSELYALRYKNDTLISKEKLREDSYLSQKKVIEHNIP